MPRVLPWLSKPSDPLPSKRRKPDASSSAKRQRTVSPVRGSNDDIDLIEPATPPPYNDELPSSPTRLAELEPLPAPEIEYMKDGIDADDAYMMVEDELFSTARLFTKHLHQEEYIRLKKLARSRMQEAVDGAGRGVDNKTRQSGEVKMKHKAIGHAKSIKKGLKDAETTSPETKQTFLTRLMQKDNTVAADLTGFVKTKVKTKASMKIEPVNVPSRASGVNMKAPAHRYTASTTSILDSLGILRPAHGQISTTQAEVSPHNDGTDDSDLDTPSAYASNRQNSSSTASQVKHVARTEPTKSYHDDIKEEGTSTDRLTARNSASDYLAKRRAALESRQL